MNSKAYSQPGEKGTDTNQASEGEQRTLDDILSQAFTDGASDTMWQNDKHVEIFATAKKELLAIIRTEKLKLLDEVRERVEQSLPDTTFLGTSIRVKDNIRDDGYHDGVRDSRLSIEEELTKLEAEL